MLNQVKISTILEYYKSYVVEIDLCRENLVYKIIKWKKLIFHKKIQDINNNKYFNFIKRYEI